MRRIVIKDYHNIFIGEYPFHKQLKDEISPILENCYDEMGKKTNVKATMTDWNWGSDIVRVQRLKECILKEVHSNMKWRTFDENDKVTDLIMHDFWGNIYKKGDYTIPHDHLKCDFSFAYFLKTKWYHPPFIFTTSRRKIRPKEGTYIIFPSYLIHHVPKNRFKETRITLVGNMSFDNKDLFSYVK